MRVPSRPRWTRHIIPATLTACVLTFFPSRVVVAPRLPVAASVQHAPDFVATPSSLSFRADAGGPNPQNQTLILGVSNFDTLSWTSAHSHGWLNLSPGGGWTPSTLLVSVDLARLPVGIHRDTIRFHSADVANSPLRVPVELVLPLFGVSDSDFISVIPKVTSVAERDRDTSFTVAVYLEHSRTLGAVALPLSFAGHPSLRIDSSVNGASGAGGISFGPTGADPAWTFRTTLLDNSAGTILIGFISFGSIQPSSDTLCHVHFLLDSSGINAVVPIDSTTILTSHLTITDTTANELTPQWSGGVIQIGDSTAPPEICITPTALSFAAVSGGPLPMDQTLSLANCGGGVLEWTASDDAPWLNIFPDSGLGPAATISVSITNTQLPADTLLGIITVTDPHAVNSPQSVMVVYTLSEPPSDSHYLAVVPETTYVASPWMDTSFHVAIWIDSRTDLGGITIPLTCIGHPTLHIDTSFPGDGGPGISWGPAGSDPPWTIRTSQIDDSARSVLLSLVTFSSLPPTQDTLAFVHFRTDTSGVPGVVPIDSILIPPANHLVVTDLSAGDHIPNWSPGYVHIDDGLMPPWICLDPHRLTFMAEAFGPLPPVQGFSLVNCGPGLLDFFVSADVPWLEVSPVAGNLNVATIMVNITDTGFPPDTLQGTVRIESARAGNSPQTVDVMYVLTGSVPEPDSLAVFPETTYVSSPDLDTSLHVGLVIKNQTTLGAIAVPLTVAGHPALRIDTTIITPPDMKGVTYGPAGNDPAWTIRTSLVDNDRRSILLGFISFSSFGPSADTLAYIHCDLDSSGSGGLIAVDSTHIGSSSLAFTDTFAQDYIPEWSRGYIRIDTADVPTRICLDRQELLFEAVQLGSPPPDQRIVLRNCGVDTLQWQLTDDADWLTVVPHAGVGNTETLTVSATRTDLPVARHTAMVTITSTNADNSPESVTVAYDISRGPDRLYLVPASITLPGGVDTTFELTVMLELGSTLATGIVVPLTFAGSGPGLTIDTTVTDGFGNVGVTQRALGVHPTWDSRAAIVDNVNQTILIGYTSFGQGLTPPRHDSLVTIHFRLEGDSGNTVVHVDTTTLPPGHVLGIHDPWAGETEPGWAGGTITTDIMTGIEESHEMRPLYALHPTYPNPFNAATTIRFTVGGDGRPVSVSLAVYNILGERVRTLIHGPVPAGVNQITWDGTDDHGHGVGSGVYLVVLQAGTQREMVKNLLLK